MSDPYKKLCQEMGACGWMTDLIFCAESPRPKRKDSEKVLRASGTYRLFRKFGSDTPKFLNPSAQYGLLEYSKKGEHVHPVLVSGDGKFIQNLTNRAISLYSDFNPNRINPLGAAFDMNGAPTSRYLKFREDSKEAK